jgi:hypothetical protein
MNQKEHGSSSDQSLPDQEQVETPAVSTSRRSLLAKGWVVPVVVGISLPKSGFAMNISSDEEFPGN